ncbi:uncharacterized protein A4U43_UnF6350 [Asparagus officinalis]|uniref:Uncharacterized protein n=1 Tax=Asparagus officinalis TaxID=4686 RepID=A0A1R3L6I2_ASPOF|nr:uncharacterized protein LOC109827674 [Asparagus officinalis]ONK55214.1 uncharacterized protein A4U43_UnF6350 [Asparagus officinalis]
MAMEVEDDIFFADLSRQISLLIMDDDDEGGGGLFQTQSPPPHFQGFHHMQQQQSMMPQSYMYHYQMSCRRESKGTGVFIPRSSPYPRSKNKVTGKSNSANSLSQRHLDDSAVTVSHATANNEELHSHCKSSGSIKNNG